MKALQWVYVKNTGKPVDTFCVKRIVPDQIESLTKPVHGKGCYGISKMIWSQTRPLLKMPYITRLVICCYMQLSTFVSSAAMGLWFTYLLNQISRSQVTGTLCDILRTSNSFPTGTINQTDSDVCIDTTTEKAFKDTILIGIYYIIGLSLIAIFVQRIGRGYILMTTFLVASIAGYLILWITNPSIGIFLLSLLLVLPGCSISLVSGSSVHLFPTTVRAMAISLMLMIGRLATTFGTSLIGSTMQSHCEETFFIVTTIVLSELN